MRIINYIEKNRDIIGNTMMVIGMVELVFILMYYGFIGGFA